MRTPKEIKKTSKIHRSYIRTGAFWGFIIGFFIFGILFNYIPFRIWDIATGQFYLWSRWDTFLMFVYIVMGIGGALLGTIIGFIIKKIKKK